jgi:hypothetical protein
MPDEPRVQELLAELIDREATPEEVCGACPDLLPVVRERWRQICRARAELDALLPISPHGTISTMQPEGLPLPQVPGYEVESVLGRGGMGVVYRARHLRLGRLVALKMTLAGSYAGPHERERFRREAEAVAALRHPNLVQVYDAGQRANRKLATAPARWHPDDCEWYERWEKGRTGHAVFGTYTRGGTVVTVGTTDWWRCGANHAQRARSAGALTPKACKMDPYEEERVAKDKALAIVELREAMDEGVKKGWFYATVDEQGERSYGLTEEGKRAMQRGELG